MKQVLSLLLFGLMLIACKKDHVDATTTQTLQSSINDMTSSLTTLKQDKFNEALYILKTFGVEVEGDTSELAEMGKLINGKNIAEIFLLADQVAQENGIEWTSSDPPSLGTLNIFEEAKESDPNDITASSINLRVNQITSDSIFGAKAIQIIPRLVDASGKEITFSGAALEVELQVFSNGSRVYNSKNLMQNNQFKGFTLKFASLARQKIVDNKIDITVSVKTTKESLKMSKIGVPVNPQALLIPAEKPADSLIYQNAEVAPVSSVDTGITTPNIATPAPTPAADPKTSVTRFLNNLSAENLKAAYETADNPNWGSFENFSNPTSGFGGVKSVSVKNITTTQTTASAASVSASYDVTDKNGKTTALQVNFGLKNVNGDWKISSYKIN
jgi:hypothetical protein